MSSPEELTAAERAVLGHLDEAVLVESLMELVRIPSMGGTDAEIEVQEHAAAMLRDLDTEVDRWDIDLAELAEDPWFPGVEVTREQAVGVVGVTAGEGMPGLVLQGHLDVVPPGDPDNWLGREPVLRGDPRGRDVRPRHLRHPGRAAAARALQGPVTVVSDSTYALTRFRDGWWRGWLERGWTTSARKPVANRDLWEPLVTLVDDLRRGVPVGEGPLRRRDERPGRPACRPTSPPGQLVGRHPGPTCAAEPDRRPAQVRRLFYARPDDQASASIAASVRSPTVSTGIAWTPVANIETSGPGPSFAVLDARTRMEMSLSDLMSSRSASVAACPSASTSSEMMPESSLTSLVAA